MQNRERYLVRYSPSQRRFHIAEANDIARETQHSTLDEEPSAFVPTATYSTVKEARETCEEIIFEMLRHGRKSDEYVLTIRMPDGQSHKKTYRKQEMTKRRFTIEEHREVGRELQRTYQMLLDLQNRLSRAYGKTKPVVCKTRQVVKKLLALLSKLDDVVCGEHPTDDSVLRFYYGNPDDDPKITNQSNHAADHL